MRALLNQVDMDCILSGHDPLLFWVGEKVTFAKFRRGYVAPQGTSLGGQQLR